MTKLSDKLTNDKGGVIVLLMTQRENTFGELFKKYRLKSEFPTLSQFGNALAQEGFIYEDSLYSHWQNNVRIPRDRKLLFALIKLFIKKGGITTINDVDSFLSSTGLGYLTDQEKIYTLSLFNTSTKTISPKATLMFLNSTAQSKKVMRTGWKVMCINNPESIADHCYQMCVMVMIFGDMLDVDKEKLMKMIVLYGLGGALTKDVVWARGNIIDIEKRRKKEQIEADGIEKLFSTIGKTDEYKGLFEEMTQRRSVEADIFWQLDKLEMAIQALQYEQETGKQLDEFFVNADLQITSPFLRSIFAHVLAQRPKKKKSK